MTGRIVADIFSRHLGQKFVVENVGGTAGTTGALRAARAAVDGYTILSGHLGTNALASAFYPNLGYDKLNVGHVGLGSAAQWPAGREGQSYRSEDIVKTYQLFINGQYVDPANGEWFDSIDPYRGKPWAKIPRGTAARCRQGREGRQRGNVARSLVENDGVGAR